MIVQRRGAGLVVHTPAKLNLFLDVLDRRSDGFHELETVITAIRLYDRLELRSARAGDFQLVTETSRVLARGSHNQLPDPSQNTVVRALQQLAEAAGVDAGMHVHLLKRIPSQAGLGGASSDAAAALLAANLLWQLNWSPQQLADVGARVGSDVPFFFFGPNAICRGRGEIVEPVRAASPLQMVLVHPPAGLSTADVFGQCQPGRSADPTALLAALEQGDHAGLARQMHNGLEQAAAELQPWISQLRKLFAEAGCSAYQMTGSGSSFFGLCHHALHARRVASRLRNRQAGHVQCVSTTGRWQLPSPSIN